MKNMSKANFKKLLKVTAPTSVVKSYGLPNGDGVEIEIASNIGIIQRGAMVSDIVDLMFIGDEYQSYLYNSMVSYFLIKNLTNIPLDSLIQKTDDGQILSEKAINSVLQLAQGTAIMEDIKQTVGADTYNEIIREINDGIEFKKQLAIQKASAFNQVMEALEGVVDGVLASVKKFENFNPDDLKGLAQKIQSIDDKKIIEFVADKDEN